MPGPPYDTAQSLMAARAGSPEALGEVLEACRFYLLGVAGREMDAGLRMKGGASDLVQETFLEAQRDFAQFRGESESELLAWLRRLLLNNMANFHRHYKETDKRRASLEVGLGGDDSARGPGPMLSDGAPTPSVQMMADEQVQELRRAMDKLPEDQRQILALRYQEGRSFEEIGALMGRSSNAARKLWGRAVERLQEELDAP
ncbi:MAG: sigW 16 [Planctomycetota bacterium]|nr:sigW 16 [Planctomycetota bacterium]